MLELFRKRTERFAKGPGSADKPEQSRGDS